MRSFWSASLISSRNFESPAYDSIPGRACVEERLDSPGILEGISRLLCAVFLAAAALLLAAWVFAVVSLPVARVFEGALKLLAARDPTSFGGLPVPLDRAGADSLSDECLGDAFVLVLVLPALEPPVLRCLAGELEAGAGLPILEPVVVRLLGGALVLAVELAFLDALSVVARLLEDIFVLPVVLVLAAALVLLAVRVLVDVVLRVVMVVADFGFSPDLPLVLIPASATARSVDFALLPVAAFAVAGLGVLPEVLPPVLVFVDPVLFFLELVLVVAINCSSRSAILHETRIILL